MASAKNSSARKDSYDIIVIGAGITGMVLGEQFSKDNKRVLLIESKDHLGGTSAAVCTDNSNFNNSLNFTPNSEENIELLTWFESILDQPLNVRVKDHQPKTYEGGEFKAFVGFGDRKFKTSNELSHWVCNEQLHMDTDTDQIREHFLNKHLGVSLLRSEVTSIEVEDDKVVSVTVNGDQRYFGEQFLVCLSPKILTELLPVDNTPHRLRQKLTKSPSWTCVQLNFQHKGQVTENEDLLFLMGNKTDFEPCVGRFFEPEGDTETGAETTQQSLWSSLVPRDLTEDSEFLGSVIRNMKKQIKRAFGNQVLEAVEDEKIIVHPEFLGQCKLDNKNTGFWPGLGNLYVASRMLGNQPTTLLGAIEAARKGLQTFGVLTPLEDSTDQLNTPQTNDLSPELGT